MWRPNCLWKDEAVYIHIYNVYIVYTHTYIYNVYIYTHTYNIDNVYIYIYTMECSVVSDSCVPIGCSLPGFSVHGIFQARILEWVAISFSRRSS